MKMLNSRAAFKLQGDNLMAEFQFQIAPLRKQHGLSQQQLAAVIPAVTAGEQNEGFIVWKRSLCPPGKRTGFYEWV